MACRQIHDSAPYDFAVLLFPFGRIMSGKMMLLCIQLCRFVPIGVLRGSYLRWDNGSFYGIEFVSVNET